MRSEPRGIGGWLLLYLSTVAVFRPSVALVQLHRLFEAHRRTSSTLDPAVLRFLVGEGVIVAMDVAICWFVTWRLLRVRDWTSIRLAIAGMWASVAIVLLARLGLLMLLTGGLPVSIVTIWVGGMARGGMYAAFWTVYLRRSRRVRATYPRGRSAAPLADVFS